MPNRPRPLPADEPTRDPEVAEETYEEVLPPSALHAPTALLGPSAEGALLAPPEREGKRRKRERQPDDLDIRELTVDEIAPVFHLGERVFTAERWPTLFRTWDEYEVLSAYQSDLETSLVAMVEDRVAGFALGTMIEKERNAWVYGYVKWVAVDPAFAGMGVGAALVRALRAVFIELGARMLLVDTEADNVQARSFFKKMGFTHETEHVYLSLNLTRERDYKRHRERQRRRVHRRNAKGAGVAHGGEDGAGGPEAEEERTAAKQAKRGPK